MAEYINRDAFLEQQRAWYCKDCNRRKNTKGKTVYEIGEAPCRACDIGTMLDAIEDYPAADMVERKILPEDSEALVTALRNCGYPGDVHYCRDCVFANDGGTCHRKKLLPAAADAIEELTDRIDGEWIPISERFPDEPPKEE